MVTGYTINGAYKDGQLVNTSFNPKEFTNAAMEYKRLLSLNNKCKESGQLNHLSLNNASGKMIHQYTNPA